MKQIEEKQVAEIIQLINKRHTIEAKEILSNLEDVKQDNKLKDELQKIIRNTGRSNMISKDKIVNLLENNK